MNNFKIGLYIFVISFLFPIVTDAMILFEDNFDNSIDWQSKQTVSKATGGQDIYVMRKQDGSCTGSCPGGNCTNYCPPQGWSGYYVSASYWADNRGDDTYILSAEGAYGGSGKGITYNHESVGTWAGGRLLLWLGETGYDELYVRMRVKYSPDWSWSDGTGHAQQKWLRISSYWGNLYTGEPNIYQFQLAGLNENVAYPDFYYNNSTKSATFQATLMRSPNYTETWKNFPSFNAFTDGKWHTIEFRVKMNSLPGAEDGVFEAWLDGGKQVSLTNVIWRDAGSAAKVGWNTIMPLDNMYTSFQGSMRKEQKLYMDDIVVSTNYIGTDYIITNKLSSPPSVPENFQWKPIGY